MNLIDTVQRLSDFFEIPSTLQWVEMADWSYLDKFRRGVYVITTADGALDTTKIVYVGKGFFRARQSSHWAKLTGTISPGQIDPKGWKWLREHHELDLSNWRVYLVDLPLETQLSAMEGGLIHLLQPLANDETFTDRQKSV
jgi:hypothetical protein